MDTVSTDTGLPLSTFPDVRFIVAPMNSKDAATTEKDDGESGGASGTCGGCGADVFGAACACGYVVDPLARPADDPRAEADATSSLLDELRKPG